MSHQQLMSREEIVERNYRIALLMGAVPEQWYPPSDQYGQSGVHMAFPQGKWYPGNQRYHCKELLKFHSEWNWLMPAVKFMINYFESREWTCTRLLRMSLDSSLEEIFLAVSDYAQHFTKQENPAPER
jgi:hypothetical protein